MSDGPLSPEEVAHRGFPTTFRGFDTNEVRSYLQRVANELKTSTVRERELHRRLADAEHRAANPVIDNDTLTKGLGEEMARILATAQQAASELKARAEENAARILREAHEQAQRIRAQAEAVLADRSDEAEAQAGEIRRAAAAEAAGVLDRARREASGAMADVEAKTRQLVQEAQAARARVVADLTRRRRTMMMQVEQLRAGRERLLEAYRMVRRTTDEVAEELQRVEAEAREAAAGVAEPASADAEPVEEIDDVMAAFPERVVEAATDPVEAAHLAVDEPPDETPESHPSVPTPQIAAVASPETETETETESDASPAAPRSSPAAAASGAPGAAGERRPTPLRLLRKPRPDGRAGHLDVVARPEQGEGVRIIAAAAQPAAPPDDAVEATTETAPGGEDGLATDVAHTAGTAAADTPAAGTAVAGTAVAGTAAAADSADPGPAPVDELFARIRAGRADAVAKAHEVLAAEPGDHDAPAGSVEPGGGAATEGLAVDTPGADAPSGIEEGLLQRRDRAVEGIEQRLTRKLKRALQDEQNEVLDRLRSSKSGADASAVLPAVEDQARRYRSAAEELVAAAAAEGAAFVSPGADARPDVAGLVADLATSLAEPLRRALERALGGDASGDAGGDQTAVVERIGAAYRECKAQRIEGLAGDCVTAAFSRGALAALPPGGAARWIVDDDGRPCPDCDDNALAGPTPTGEAFPTGQPHPPAHAGCRCLLAPVQLAAAANGSG